MYDISSVKTVIYVASIALVIIALAMIVLAKTDRWRNIGIWTAMGVVVLLAVLFIVRRFLR